jgi:hypothetical protein
MAGGIWEDGGHFGSGFLLSLPIHSPFVLLFKVTASKQGIIDGAVCLQLSF